jgi:hypothetical protein
LKVQNMGAVASTKNLWHEMITLLTYSAMKSSNLSCKWTIWYRTLWNFIIYTGHLVLSRYEES